MAEAGKNFYRYNAKQIKIAVAGIAVTGLAEEPWTFAKEQALGEAAEGAQGDVVWNVTNSTLYKATVSVQQSSPDIDRLYDLANYVGDKGEEEFPIYMTDTKKGIQEGGSKAVLAEIPEDTRGKTANDLTFTFYVFDGARTKV